MKKQSTLLGNPYNVIFIVWHEKLVQRFFIRLKKKKEKKKKKKKSKRCFTVSWHGIRET